MWPSIPSSLCLPPARLLRVLSTGTVAQHSGESCALSVEVEQVGCGGATVAQHSGESCALSVEVEQVGCGGATVAQHSGESCAFLHGLAPPSLVSSLVSLPTFSLPLPAFPLPAESVFRHQLAQHSAVSAAPLLSPFLQTALFLPLYPILSTLFPSFPTHLIWPHSHLCSCLCSLCCSYPLPSKRSSSFPSTPSHHQALRYAPPCMSPSSPLLFSHIPSFRFLPIQALLFFRSTPSPPPGLKVTSVHPLSPLFSHIRPGDSLLVLDQTPLSSPADYTHLLSHLSHLSHLSYPLPPSIPPSPPSRGYCISLSANHKLPPGFLTPPAFPANGIRLHGPSPSSSPSAAPSAVSALPLLTLLLLDLFLLFQFLSFLLHFLRSLLSSVSPLWGPVVVTRVALFVFHVSNALALINAAPIFFLDGEAILSDFLRLVLPFPSHPLSSHPLSSHHLHLRHQQQIIRHHRILTSVLYGGSFFFFVSLASSIMFSHT
ncbi:unnamed protein product [Closterium sp. NIES-64]|nr:unnamed protein product [Closterium sp. NIES-64]